jgi:hypothetical protein
VPSNKEGRGETEREETMKSTHDFIVDVIIISERWLLTSPEQLYSVKLTRPAVLRTIAVLSDMFTAHATSKLRAMYDFLLYRQGRLITAMPPLLPYCFADEGSLISVPDIVTTYISGYVSMGMEEEDHWEKYRLLILPAVRRLNGYSGVDHDSNTK